MKLTHINVPNLNAPSFAYLVCKDNEKFFVPVFDICYVVSDFKQVGFKDTSLIDVNKEQQIEIEKGDQGLFAYYTGNDTLIANAEELVVRLLELAKEQNMHEGYFRSFEAFAKKYDVFTVYLREYDKHYGPCPETVRLLAHAATDNTNYFAKKWATKKWASFQKEHPELSGAIHLDRTREGEVCASFEDNKKTSVCKKCQNRTVLEEQLRKLQKQNVPCKLIMQRRPPSGGAVAFNQAKSGVVLGFTSRLVPRVSRKRPTDGR